MSTARFTLEELLRKVMDKRIADVRTAIPGKVNAYDPATQTADIQILIDDFVETEADGIYTEQLPVLPNVPVAVYSGGGYFIHVPLEKGDTGLVIFQERATDYWHKTGKQAPPLDYRRHALASAMFYPGGRASTTAIDEAQAGMLVAGKDGGLQLRISAGAIELGAKDSANLDYVALAAKVRAELIKVASALTAVSNGGAALTGANTYTVPGGVAATKLKGE
jgi:hypothetical protein